MSRSPELALISEVLRRRLRPLLLGCGAATVHQTCEALVPVAIGLAIDIAVTGGQISQIVIAAAGILVLFVFLMVGGAVGYWLVDATALREGHFLRVRTMRELLAAPGGGGSAGDVLNAVTSDARRTADSLRIINRLVSAGIGLLVSAVVLLRVDLTLGLGLLLVAPLLVVGIDRLSPWLAERAHQRQQTSGRAAAMAAELVRALRPLRGFGGVPQAVLRYQRENRASVEAAKAAASANALLTGAGLIATGIITVAAGGVGVAFAATGRISIGDLVIVVAMASFLADPIRGVSESIKQLAESRASARRLLAVQAAIRAQRVPTGTTGSATLTFAGVHHGPLHGLDLEIPSGALLAVATADSVAADALLDLLAGRAAPERGSLLLGGLPLSDIAPDERRRHLHVEPHAVQLLGGSLRAALDTGPVPDNAPAPDQALVSAGAGDLWESLSEPDGPGLDATLQDHGSNLSGGQQQRVALARALRSAAPVLVLRDPFTAVDAVTEDLAASGVRALRADKDWSTVILTNSPLVLGRADVVWFIDADGIGTLGTHHELAARADYSAVVAR